MSFQVNKGLFSLDDFTDCHAILGVPITAETNTIRKRYLKIARKLHPDSFIGQDTEYADLATQLFSKLVGPAYNTLSQERERKEYALLIQLKGKQAVQQMVAMESFGETAQALAKAENFDQMYQESLETLAEGQYESLPQSLEITGQISELNLVYLMRQANPKAFSASAPTAAGAAATSPSSSGSSPSTSAGAPSGPGTSPGASPAASTSTSSLDNYLRRAAEYIAQKDFRSATLDLRDAMRIDPNDSRCHGLMGKLYLAQGNLPMARVSVKRSLELDPKNPEALKAKKELEKRGQVVDVGKAKGGSQPGGKGASRSKTPPNSPKGGKSDSGGGFLGGLFGGKKK